MRNIKSLSLVNNIQIILLFNLYVFYFIIKSSHHIFCVCVYNIHTVLTIIKQFRQWYLLDHVCEILVTHFNTYFINTSKQLIAYSNMAFLNLIVMLPYLMSVCGFVCNCKYVLCIVRERSFISILWFI